MNVEDMQRAIQGNQAVRNNLDDIVTAEAVLASGVLEDPSVRAELIALLPDGQQSEEFLHENLHCSQLRQSLGALSNALNSDNFNSVVANIGGFDPTPGMPHLLQGDGVGAFLAVVQAAHPPDSSTAAPHGDVPPLDFGEDQNDSKDGSAMEE
jgi:UCH-binding domain